MCQLIVNMTDSKNEASFTPQHLLALALREWGEFVSEHFFRINKSDKFVSFS